MYVGLIGPVSVAELVFVLVVATLLFGATKLSKLPKLSKLSRRAGPDGPVQALQPEPIPLVDARRSHPRFRRRR